MRKIAKWWLLRRCIVKVAWCYLAVLVVVIFAFLLWLDLWVTVSIIAAIAVVAALFWSILIIAEDAL